MKLPIALSVPHAGLCVPEHLRRNCLLSAEQIAADGDVGARAIYDLREHVEAGTLRLEKLGRGVAWLDTGTPEALLQAANFIQTIETRQGLQVACPEEVAFRKKWIDDKQLMGLAEPLMKTAYGQYLADLAKGETR